MSIRKDIDFKLATSLLEVLAIRQLRNTCRECLNHTKYIGILRQAHWYFFYYRRAVCLSIYRLFIVRDYDGVLVGYGALHLRSGKLYVTECIAPEYRGLGFGRAILENLISIACDEGLPLMAEIRDDNDNSIKLHGAYGFIVEAKTGLGDANLRAYRWQS